MMSHIITHVSSRNLIEYIFPSIGGKTRIELYDIMENGGTVVTHGYPIDRCIFCITFQIPQFWRIWYGWKDSDLRIFKMTKLG